MPLATVVAVSEMGSPIKRASLAVHGKRTQSIRKGSSSLRSSSSWKLKYQDFFPSCKEEFGFKSEHYQKLVDKANLWLRKNVYVSVKTCETVTWISSNFKRLNDSEEMVQSKQLREGADNYYVRGLRLWLMPQCVRAAQSLAYEDFVPEANDRIQELVDRINRRFKHKHLHTESVVTVETVFCPVIGDRVCHRVTRWRECVDDDTPYAFVLRLFYAKSGRKTDARKMALTIGLKDMVPLATEDTGYEGFEVLTEKVNSWLKDQNDVVMVTNMQSIMVEKGEGPHDEIGKCCRYSMPGINNPVPVEFFRILRVVYLKAAASYSSSEPPQEKDDCPTPLPSAPFAYETFTPELVREKEAGVGQVERLERMRETFSKVIAFLSNTGADVICAETVMNPMQLYCSDETGQQTNGNYDEEMKFLFTIRLYLAGSLSPLSNGSSRFVRKMSSAANLSAGESSLDGLGQSSPLFLRSVVSGQFKHRWLVIGIFAISCMAIIVIVSVVYSNK